MDSVAISLSLVGLGQGGGRIARAFWDQGYRSVLAVNTAEQDLSALKSEDEYSDFPTLDLGSGGAGQDPEKGRARVAAAREDIWDAMDFHKVAVPENTELTLVCASLGGGTGSGGLVPLIEMLRNRNDDVRGNMRVGAVVSLPADYEGTRTCRNAVLAWRALMRLNLSPIIVLDNARLNKLVRTGALQFYDAANRLAASAFHAFNRLAALPSGLITFDPADYRELLGQGILTCSSTRFLAEDGKADKSQLSSAIRQQTFSQEFFASCDLSKATHLACLFVGSDRLLEDLMMDDFANVFRMLKRNVSDQATIYRGVYRGEADELRCFTMLGGLPEPAETLKNLKAACGKLQLGDDDYLGV